MTETTETTTDLALVATTAMAQLAPFEQELQTFRDLYADVVYDLDDPEIERQARSDRLAVAKVIGRLDDRHRDVKAPLLEATRALDGRRKEIKDELDAIRVHIKSQIDEHEQREEKRVEALVARIEQVRGFAECADQSSEVIATRVAAVESIPIDDSWQEYAAEARLVQAQTIKRLHTALDAATTREAEQAELARLREESERRAREDHDRRVAEEEAARVRAEAAAEAQRVEQARRTEQEARERAEAERLQAAERERLAAIVAQERAEQAMADAEERRRQDAIDAEIKAAREEEEAAARLKEAAEDAARAERQRIEDEQRKERERIEEENRVEAARKAKQQHRAMIHGEARDSLIDAGLDNDTATIIVTAIRDGLIAHVRIDY